MRISARLRLASVPLLLLFFAPAAFARQTPTLPATAPVPTIRTTSRIVYVDIVVRDSSGHVVTGLDRNVFNLTEDGKPQRIELFEVHTGSAMQPPTPTGPAALHANIPSNAQDLSLNIVLFDLLDTDPLDQAFARARMIAFLRALPPGKQVALFVLSDRLHMVQGFTADSNILARAAQSIDFQQLNRLRAPSQQMRDLDLEAYSDSQATIASVGGAMERALRFEDFTNLKSRLDAQADAFSELSRAVNGYPGRKNLFWLAGHFPSAETSTLSPISTGQLTSIGGPGIGNTDPRTGVATRGTANALSLSHANGGFRTPLSERADRAVADSQIAVYPISLTGVETDSVGADQNGIGTANGSLADTNAQLFHDRQDSRSTMENIARETGGEPFYGNNDVSHLLRRGFEDSENYYTLAFQPTDHDWNGRYRKLAVSLTAHGYSLSYRRGYYALPEQPAANAAHQFQTAMRLDSPPSTMLTLRASFNRAPGTPPAAQVETTLDIRGLGFTSDTEGKRHARLQVGIMAYPVGTANTPSQTSGTLNLNLTPEQYVSLLETGVFLHQHLPLPGGRYVVRIGVLDTGSGRIGTLTLPIQMP